MRIRNKYGSSFHKLPVSYTHLGKYTLCVGLTDKTKNNEAAIDLAVSGNLKIGKWIFVVELEL